MWFDSKAAVYLAEAQALADTRADLYAAISDGLLTAEDLTSPYALEDIHLSGYGSVWKWAGKLRVREVSIGVAPDVLLLAMTGDRIFEWTDSPDYFVALRRADQTMNPQELLSVVGVMELD